MNKIVPQILIEDSRAKLIGQSKSSQKGMQRYNRRVKSRVANTVKQYNSIDMNKLFKEDILTVNINVNGETDDYIVRISFGGFSDLVQEEIKRGGNKLDLRTIIRALVKGFNQEDVYVHCSCLYPDTKIKLLDGTSPTVEDMKKRFDNGEKLYVCSVDENGDFVPGVVENVFITKETSDFIKVTLDNGEEILTTPEHRYMLRNGEWEEAQNLVEGQSLMPLYFDKTQNGYDRVKFNSTSRYHSVYKEVANYFYGGDISKLEEESKQKCHEKKMRYPVAIHHKDFNKQNNSPENLQVMDSYDHWMYHASLLSEKWKDNSFRKMQSKKATERIRRLNENPTENMLAVREKFLKMGVAHNYDPNWKPIQSGIMRKTSREYWDNLTDEQREEVSERLSRQYKRAWANGCFDTDAYKEASRRRGEFLRSEEIEKLAAQGVRRYWSEISGEDKERRLAVCRENIKKAQDSVRGKRLSDEHREKISRTRSMRTEEQWKETADKYRESMKKRTPEQEAIRLKKSVDSRIKNTLAEMLSRGLTPSFENYNLCRGKKTCVPLLEKRFSTIEDALDYFGMRDNYNHKVIRIERITLEETPVYDISVKDHHNFCVDAGVILHNCDDFRYRFNYWATRNDINSGTPEFRPSDITNPDNSLGSSCKHVLLVLNNNAWIIKVASVINNYIKYMAKNYEKLYADIIYPAVYGKKYTGAVQTGIFDDEKDITTDADTGELDKAIEYGKKSTQFQKGNKQGYKFVSDKDTEQQSIDDVEEED